MVSFNFLELKIAYLNELIQKLRSLSQKQGKKDRNWIKRQKLKKLIKLKQNFVELNIIQNLLMS